MAPPVSEITVVDYGSRLLPYPNSSLTVSGLTVTLSYYGSLTVLLPYPQSLPYPIPAAPLDFNNEAAVDSAVAELAASQEEGEEKKVT